ncbi:hypothetical protein [Brucella pituitosa]|uniref:hypothetical protein n=1 Tax=Brucella pituitosa TaxID=571256 RepID=UPI003F4AF45E
MFGQTLVSLLPVIIGGLIGLLGAAVVPIVSHLLTSKTERKRERIAKFEELFELLSDYEQWIDTENMRIVWGEKTVRRPSPLLRAQAICAIYFHELKLPLADLSTAAAPYFVWMGNAGMRRIRKAPDINEGFNDAYIPFRQQWNKCVEAVSDYATRKGNNL